MSGATPPFPHITSWCADSWRTGTTLYLISRHVAYVTSIWVFRLYSVEWVDDRREINRKWCGSGRGLTVNYPCFYLEILRKMTKKSWVRTDSASTETRTQQLRCAKLPGHASIFLRSAVPDLRVQTEGTCYPARSAIDTKYVNGFNSLNVKW
jgi:hypothetical protein